MEYKVQPDIHEQLPEETYTCDDDNQADRILHIIQDLRRRLRHSDELARALHAELDVARARYDTAETLASERAREINRLMTELQEARNEYARLLAALSASNDERGEAVLEIRRLTQELVDSQDTVRHLQQELRDQSRSAGEAIRGVESRADTLTRTLEEARQTIQKLEERLEKRTRQFDEALASNEDIACEVEHLREEIVRLERSRLALRRIHSTLSDAGQDERDESKAGGP